ncbi:MAG: hypothetical protein HDR88_17805 [Bacteroides sp.]|nr:hypothetical protein [Bacteroides sp.]
MKSIKKNIISSRKALRIALAVILAIGSAVSVSAQNSLPAPGSGGSFNPAPVGGGPGPGNGPGSGIIGNPGPGPAWGNPWGPGGTPFNNPSWQNQGTTTVIACGYDNTGIYRTLPLYVEYTFNGAQYDVTVLNAWNPFTDTWNRGVDEPAYNTSYYLRGNNYDFYTVTTTGTYYFNL